MSHFATYLAHQFGIVFGFDVLGFGGLGWLLLVLSSCFVVRFLSETISAVSPFVSGDSAVATLTVEFALCPPVLGWLGVG